MLRIKKMDSINGNTIEGLEDSALVDKISRTKKELVNRDRMAVKALPDDRKTYLMQILKSLLDERERRERGGLPRQKAETSKAAAARRSEMIGMVDYQYVLAPHADSTREREKKYIDPRFERKKQKITELKSESDKAETLIQKMDLEARKLAAKSEGYFEVLSLY